MIWYDSKSQPSLEWWYDTVPMLSLFMLVLPRGGCSLGPWADYLSLSSWSWFPSSHWVTSLPSSGWESVFVLNAVATSNGSTLFLHVQKFSAGVEKECFSFSPVSFGISPRDLWTLHGHKIPGNCSKRNYRLHFLLMILLSHPYMATEKVIALTIWTFVSKVMSLFLIYCLAFFPRCKCLLISGLQLPSTVILETRKIKSSHIVKAKFFPVVKYGYESCTIKKAEHWKIDAFELWSWRRLESLLDSKEIKPFIPKGNQPWIFIGRTDTEAEAPVLWSPDVKSQHIGKDSDARKDQRQKKWATENEMVGWHHWLNGNEFKQTLGDRERQGSLVCCSPWGHKESTRQ